MAIIEVVSDVVCPWCFIGKRRLEKAVVLLGKPDTQIRWKPFQLNPSAPKQGMDRQEYRVRKFGTATISKELEDRVAAAGAEDGIHFRFDDIKMIPNTFDAHRLIWLAGQEGDQNTLVENLFQAYFLNGEDIGAPEVLIGIAKRSGISANEFLSGNRGGQEIAAEEHNARRQAVSGVPSFFIGGNPITSGAHKPELLAQMLAPALLGVAQQ